MISYTLLLLLYAVGDATRSYPGSATRNGYPMGARFRGTKILQIAGVFLGMIPAVICAIAENSWEIALSFVPLGFLLGIVVTAIAKEWIQIAGPVLLIVLLVTCLVLRV